MKPSPRAHPAALLLVAVAAGLHWLRINRPPVLEARPGGNMSGDTDSAVVQSGIPNGAAAFIEKPFTPQVLARKVREALDLAGSSDRSGSAPVTKEPWPHRSAS